MSKIYNFYDNKMDRTWYNSSNIKYSECDDNVDALKTVRIVFGDGRTYQYTNVNVNDYLLFREDLSQGKALNKFLKTYEVTRLDNSDLSFIDSEMHRLQEDTDYEIYNKDGLFSIKNKNNEIIFEESVENITKDPIDNIIKAISSLNVKIKYNAD